MKVSLLTNYNPHGAYKAQVLGFWDHISVFFKACRLLTNAQTGLKNTALDSRDG